MQAILECTQHSLYELSLHERCQGSWLCSMYVLVVAVLYLLSMSGRSLALPEHFNSSRHLEVQGTGSKLQRIA